MLAFAADAGASAALGGQHAGVAGVGVGVPLTNVLPGLNERVYPWVSWAFCGTRCGLGSASPAGARERFGGRVDGCEAWLDVALHRPQALVPGLGHDHAGGDVGLAEADS